MVKENNKEKLKWGQFIASKSTKDNFMKAITAKDKPVNLGKKQNVKIY